MTQTKVSPKSAGMQVVHVGQGFPSRMTKSIMLVGPTPRDAHVSSWRPEAIRILESLGYDGVVFVPEGKHSTWATNYETQIETEERMLHTADCIVCWVPRELATMPGFTTNDEYGTWKCSGKVVFGAPEDAAKVRYQRYYANKLSIPSHTTLEATLVSAMERLGAGALREDGERQVPLYIWQTPSFQQWYKNLREAGNRLDGARVEWTFRTRKNRSCIFCWALHVDIYVASEGRHKTNEVVISRPDIATVVAYRRGETLLDTDIVLIKEFRSPVSNSKGFVYEVPGGSSFKHGGNPRQLATDECREETGLVISAERMLQHESRQLVATFSAHHAHLFSVELTEQEIAELRGAEGITHGAEGSSERTYVEVKKLSEIMRADSGVDWSVLGMILSVVSK